MKKRWWLVIGIVILLIIIMALWLIFFRCPKVIEPINPDNLDKITRESSISKMFRDDENRKLNIYPDSRTIKLEKGSKNSGIAFSVKNFEPLDQKYHYTITLDSGFNVSKKCGGLTIEEAEHFVDISEDEFDILANSTMQSPGLITFTIPDNAPKCTIPYNIQVKYNGAGSAGLYVEDRFYVTIIDKKGFLSC